MRILLIIGLFFIASCANKEPVKIEQPADQRINRSQQNTDSLFDELD